MIRKEDLIITESNTIETSNTDGKIRIVFAPVYAEEYWGPNNNGDAFPEDQIKKYYKTFETANVHLEHKREKVVGKVLSARWDDEMKRVIVTAEFDANKVPKEIVERLSKDKAVGSSMGCTVAFDVCSVCGNISRNSSDKCEHIRENLLGVDERTGKLVYMQNFLIKWDDLSLVAAPARVLAYSLWHTRPGETRFIKSKFDFKPPKKRRYEV